MSDYISISDEELLALFNKNLSLRKALIKAGKTKNGNIIYDGGTSIVLMYKPYLFARIANLLGRNIRYKPIKGKSTLKFSGTFKYGGFEILSYAYSMEEFDYE